MLKLNILFLLIFIVWHSILYSKNLIVYPAIFDETNNLMTYEDIIENNINYKNIVVYKETPITFIATVVDANDIKKKYSSEIFWNLITGKTHFLNWFPRQESKIVDRNLLTTKTLNQTSNVRVQVFHPKNNFIQGASIFKNITLNEHQSAVSFTSFDALQERLFVYSPDVIDVNLTNNFNISFEKAPPPAFDIVVNNIGGPVIISQKSVNNEIINFANYDLKVNVRQGHRFNSPILVQLPHNFYFADDFGNKLTQDNKRLSQFFILTISGTKPIIDNNILNKLVTIQNNGLIELHPDIVANEYLSFKFNVGVDISDLAVQNHVNKINFIVPDFNYIDEEPVFVSTERNSLQYAQIDAYLIEFPDNNPAIDNNNIKYSLNIFNPGFEDLIVSNLNFKNKNQNIISVYSVQPDMSGTIIPNISFPMIIKPGHYLVINYETSSSENTLYHIEKIKIDYSVFYRDINGNLRRISDNIGKSQITLLN